MTLPAGVFPIFGLGGPGQSGPTSFGPVVDPVSAAASAIVVGRNLQLPLPEVYPIPDAHIFNLEAHVASPGAQNNIPIPGLSVEIPAATRDQLLSAACRAPSSFNMQPYRLYWVESPAARETVAQLCHGQKPAATASASAPSTRPATSPSTTGDMQI